MFCLHCGIENSQDSKFCKECGKPVTEAAAVGAGGSKRLSPQIAHELGAEQPANPQLQRLLEMAFWHNETGNIPAAIMACEAALIIDPESTTALSLLGCLYEKQGDLRKATYAFERVIEINPESEADREKLAAIQRGEYIEPVVQPIQYRWVPPAIVAMARSGPAARAAMAGFAALLVIVIASLAIYHPRSADKAGDSKAGAPPTSGLGLVAAQPNAPQYVPRRSAAASQPPTYSIFPALSSPAYAQPVAAPPVSEAPAVHANPDAIDPDTGHRYRSEQLVPPVGVAATGDSAAPDTGSVRPLSPTAGDQRAPVQVLDGSSAMPQHTVVVGTGYAGTPSAADVSDPGLPSATANPGPPPPPSHIMIRVHNDAGSGSGTDASGASGVPANPSDGYLGSATPAALSRGAQLQAKALALQQSGNYQSAASSYNRAIAAYKAQIASGVAADDARRGLAACQTGLQICQQSQ